MPEVPANIRDNLEDEKWPHASDEERRCRVSESTSLCLIVRPQLGRSFHQSYIRVQHIRRALAKALLCGMVQLLAAQEEA